MKNATATSRRAFIAGAAAGIAGLSTVALGAGIARATEGADAVDWAEECDVLVIGAGGAGMTTAITANREGADVILVESQSSALTSSTAICKGHFCVVNSPEQAEMGVEDSADLYVEDIKAAGGSFMGTYPSERALYNLDLSRVFAENSAAGEQFLKDLGFEFPQPYQTSGSTVPRTYVIDNMHMCELLAQACEDEGVQVEYNTEFERLVIGNDGKVLGALVTDEDGNERAIKARKATVLATGSFVRNAELVEECMPGLSGMVNMCGFGDTGKGHVAAMSLGAPMWGRQLLYPTEGYGIEDLTATCELCQFGAIVVNERGSRYMDDGQYWTNDRTRALISQGKSGKYGCYMNYTVIDNAMYEEAVATGGPSGLTEKELAYLVSADTVEELAEKIDAPELPATVAKYNEDLANGGDTLFGRTQKNGAGTGDPLPLTEPPFHAWANQPGLEYDPLTSFIPNAKFQFCNMYDEPLGGDTLYGIGELILRGHVGNEYMVGSSISSNIAFGLVLGKQVAELPSWE